MMERLAAAAILGFGLAAPLAAQRPPSVRVAEIPADPADVRTLDGIVAAFYETISGPAGAPRQWARDRTLYVPGVRFFMLSERDGRPHAEIVTHQEYVERSDPGLVRDGFFESEIHRRTERFGNVAHVWSTYQFTRERGGAVLGRGVNSIQLFWDGDRWWITSAAWDGERANNPLAPPFLPAERRP